MRLGCLGCLGAIVGLLLLGSLAAGALWVWTGIQGTPTLLSGNAAKADPGAAERKLAEIGLRGSGRSTRSEPLVFGEPEVAALVSTHLADAGLDLSAVMVRLRPGQASLQGRLPLAALIEGSPMAWAVSALPRSTLRSPVWITVVGRLELEPPAGPRRPRYAEVTLLATQVGRIPVPSWLLAVMLGPRGASLLRWQAPAAVDHLEIGPGRLTLRTR
jgi:hypothetical protein